PERRDFAVVLSAREQFPAETAEVALDPVRRGQRPVLAPVGGVGGVRLPHLATALGGARRRLLPLAQRGCPPKRAERARLLVASQERSIGRRGDGSDKRPVGRPEERIALSERGELQRSAAVAKAWRRPVLGGVRALSREPADWREGGRHSPARAAGS